MTSTLTTIEIARDAEGFLADPEQWSDELAEEIAAESGIAELTPRHWQVVRFMRDRFLTTGTAPSIRSLGKESGVPIKELYELFPKGPAKLAAKIAGIPKPLRRLFSTRRAQIDAQLAAETLSAAEVLHHLTDVGVAEWHEFVEVIVNPRTGETIKVRMDLTNKVKALELLGKYHKLFTDKSEAISNVLIREYTDGDA